MQEIEEEEDEENNIGDKSRADLEEEEQVEDLKESYEIRKAAAKKLIDEKSKDRLRQAEKRSKYCFIYLSMDFQVCY